MSNCTKTQVLNGMSCSKNRSEKMLKKVVDNGGMYWYNNKADSESWGKRNRIKRVREALQEQGRQLKRKLKKTWKTLKKGIDKRKRFWYNNKAAPQEVKRSSLKIEQQWQNVKDSENSFEFKNYELFKVSRARQTRYDGDRKISLI